MIVIQNTVNIIKATELYTLVNFMLCKFYLNLKKKIEGWNQMSERRGDVMPLALKMEGGA